MFAESFSEVTKLNCHTRKNAAIAGCSADAGVDPVARAPYAHHAALAGSAATVLLCTQILLFIPTKCGHIRTLLRA